MVCFPLQTWTSRPFRITSLPVNKLFQIHEAFGLAIASEKLSSLQYLERRIDATKDSGLVNILQACFPSSATFISSVFLIPKPPLDIKKEQPEKVVIVVREPNCIAEEERDTITHEGTITEKSTGIRAAVCAIHHEENTKHGKGVLENESHGIEGRACDTDFLWNIAIDESSVQYEKVIENTVILVVALLPIYPKSPLKQ